jgi:hypothetical protein
MTINFSIKLETIKRLGNRLNNLPWLKICFFLATIFAATSTWHSFQTHTIVAYGDAESHLNIAKRVIDNLTPGMAQLGGIWLPLPHILLLPFVANDFLWRTGLAGSIVSGVAFIISAIFIFKIVKLLTRDNLTSFVGFLAFATNPNILYMQSTPMTELPLIVFFILSTYYFLKYITDRNNILNLVKTAFFGFCASLSRYDGWFLVAIEAFLIALINLPLSEIITDLKERKFANLRQLVSRAEGLSILFATLAFAGIIFWFGWDGVILRDPFYFTSSQFSAKSQQNGWLAKKQLPSYHDVVSSVSYYTVTSMSTGGILIFGVALIGLITLLRRKEDENGYWIVTILLVPYFFYVLTLYIGQSLIFIPHLTPITFEWTLFNVRYGVMMVPVIAILFAYLFYRVSLAGKILILALFLLQFGFYKVGYSKVIAYDDGTIGLSANKHPDAEGWLKKHYDSGYVLMDDYKRIFSLIGTGIPMEKTIYIGNQFYWEESLQVPERYARWIIIQKGDTMWKTFYDTPVKQGRLYKYYQKVYTSDEIIIFRLNPGLKTRI